MDDLPKAIGVSQDVESPGGKSVIVAFDRALSDDNAKVCNIDKDDNWRFYSDDFFATARIALNAALLSASKGEK